MAKTSKHKPLDKRKLS